MGRGHYGSTSSDLVSLSVTNHIQPSIFAYTEDEPCQLFSCLQLVFLSTIIYYIRHINFYFHPFYKNRYISSILYINQKRKWLFVTNTIISYSKQWNMWDQHIYNNDWNLDELFLISFCFYSKILYSSNMSFAHKICYCFTVFNNSHWLIDQKSQLARFLTWYILTVSNCVQ